MTSSSRILYAYRRVNGIQNVFVGLQIHLPTGKLYLWPWTCRKKRQHIYPYTNEELLVAEQYRWSIDDTVSKLIVQENRGSPCTNSDMQGDKVATLWVNELDIRHAVRECRIGPFTFNDREDPKRIIYIIQAEKWPPPSCYFVYHGTSAHAAHSIERSKRFQVPQDFFVTHRRPPRALPMLGPKWVYTSRSYLKARRFAYMDSRHPSSATVYPVGAVVRALVPIPFPPQTKLYVVGRLPAACDCRQRPECRDGSNFRADHIGTTADMYLNPQGVRQVWVDTAYTDRTQTFPEYLITPEDMYVSDMWYIPNPPASDLRDVQTFWPISVSPVTFI